MKASKQSMKPNAQPLSLTYSFFVFSGVQFLNPQNGRGCYVPEAERESFSHALTS